MIRRLVLSSIVFPLALASGQAATITEDFDYTAGLSLDGLNGGSNWGGAWGGSTKPTIEAGSLDFPGFPETGNKAILGNQPWSGLSLGSTFQFDSIRLIRDFALDSGINAAFDEIKVQTVPEPSTGLLVVLGMTLATVFRRKANR